MKKQIMVLAAALFVMMGSTFAQQGQPRLTAEERVTLALDKIEAGLKPGDTVKAKVKVVLTDFYNQQQKAMEEMRASGSMDREKMTELRKKLSDERDAKLKTIFTEEQMTKWTTEIEPALRPQRGGGGGQRQ